MVYQLRVLRLAFSVALLLATASAGPCNRTVASTDAAESFRDWLDSTDCEDVSVTWTNRVELLDTLQIPANVTVKISASSASSVATIAGDNTFQLIRVARDGVLHLTGLELTGGGPRFAPDSLSSTLTSYDYWYSTSSPPEVALAHSGGAVLVRGQLFASNCRFTENAAEIGGAILVGTAAKAVITNCTFSKNSADHGAGVYVFSLDQQEDHLTYATIASSSFLNNTASIGGGLCVYNGVATVENCTFVGNKAVGTSPPSQGGGFHSYGGNVHIRNSVFQENNSSGQGGGACFSFSPSEFELESCVFEGNTAQYGGGCFVDHWVQIAFSDVNFTGNSAVRSGGGLFTQHDLSLSGLNFEGNSAAVSGGGVGSVAFVTTDGFTPTVTLNSCNFTSNRCAGDGAAVWSPILSVSGCLFSSNACDGNGGAVYTTKQLVEDGTSTYSDNSAASAGGGVFMESVDWAWDTKFLGGNNSATCCYRLPPESEAYTCTDVSGQQSGRQACCGAGTIVVDNGDSSTDCQACPTGFDCSVVGPWPSLQEGFWRAQSSGFVARQCLLQEACRGGSGAPGTDPNEYCANGYEGPYCAVCQPGYSAGLGYQCNKCGSGVMAGAITAICTVAVLLALAVWYVAADVFDLDGNSVANASGASETALSVAFAGVMGVLRSVPWNTLRQPVIVFQIISQYVAITGVVFPPLYASFVSVINVLSFDMGWLLSVGCIASLDFYSRLLIATLLPLGVVAVIGLSFAWRHFSARKHAPVPSGDLPKAQEAAVHHGRGVADLMERIWSRHMMLFLIFTFFIYSTSSTIVFQTFACDSLSEVGQKWLRADYSIACSGAKYDAYRLYAAFMVVVYPIGIPVVYACFLWSQGHKIAANGRRDDVHHRLKATQFLWGPYKTKRYWWEIAECVRRLCLTGFLVFILPNSAGQSAVACVFAVMSLMVVATLAPHFEEMDFYIYVAGCVIVFFSTFLALLVEVNATNADSSSQKVLSALLIVLNVALVAAAIAQCAFVAAHVRHQVKHKSPFSSRSGSKRDVTLSLHSAALSEEEGPPEEGEAKEAPGA